MRLPLPPLLPLLILAALVIPAAVLAASPADPVPAGFLLPPSELVFNQTPRIQISDRGDLLSLAYDHSPELFVYAGNGSPLWNRTLTAEAMPWISSISIAPDGESLLATQLVPGCCHGVVTNTTSNRVLLFDRNGSVSREYAVFNPPLASVFTIGGGKSAIGLQDGRVLSLSAGGTPVTLTRLNVPVISLAASRDGRMILAGAEPSDSADLFALDTNGSLLWKFRTGGRNTAAVSDNGSVIAVLAQPSGDLYILNRSGGLVTRRPVNGTAAGCAVTGDGSRIFTGSGSSILVLDSTGNLQESIPAGDEIRSLAASSDGGVIIVATRERIVLCTGEPGAGTFSCTGNSLTRESPVLPVCPPSSSATDVQVPGVNCTALPFLGTEDPAHPMDEARKTSIAGAALADQRVRTLLAGGGTIAGVLFQCHPTAKDSGDAACAPALRVLHNGTAWDFLVDEKDRTVIFVQIEVPSGAGSQAATLNFRTGEPGQAAAPGVRSAVTLNEEAPRPEAFPTPDDSSLWIATLRDSLAKSVMPGKNISGSRPAPDLL